MTGIHTIECPNCGDRVDVTAAMRQQVEDKVRTALAGEFAGRERQLGEDRDALLAGRTALVRERDVLGVAVAEQAKAVEDATATEVKVRERDLRASIVAEVAKETNDAFEVLQQELEEKSAKVAVLNKAEADLSRLRRESALQRSAIQAELQRGFDVALADERMRISRCEPGKAEMELLEKDSVIRELGAQLKDAQRRAEQGSSQRQGETQEVAIEPWLGTQFPLDSIDAVRKGIREADCLQTINTQRRLSCGRIYYESKRTKRFSVAWIAKFKSDLRESGADIGVLVTEAMPADIERMGQREGIWICTFDEMKGLAKVLRESLIRLSEALATRDNQGCKMARVYDYVTGCDYYREVEAVLSAFFELQSELDREKRALAAIWKRRQKQIERVLDGTSLIHNSICGIAGHAVEPIARFELDELAFEQGDDDRGERVRPDASTHVEALSENASDDEDGSVPARGDLDMSAQTPINLSPANPCAPFTQDVETAVA